ncbi:hypothetical protein D9M68_865270 [compost metagenome]
MGDAYGVRVSDDEKELLAPDWLSEQLKGLQEAAKALADALPMRESHLATFHAREQLIRLRKVLGCKE